MCGMGKVILAKRATWEWQVVQYGCGVMKWEVESETKEIGRGQITEDFVLDIILWVNLNFSLCIIDSHQKVWRMKLWYKLVHDVPRFSFCSDCFGAGIVSDSEVESE